MITSASKASPGQALQTQWQPLGAADGVTQGAGEEQSVPSSVIAGTVISRL